MDLGSLASPMALDRFRPMWMAIEGALLVVGMLFWISVGLGISSFSPETWGELACSLPARVWAATQFGAAALIVTGARAADHVAPGGAGCFRPGVPVFGPCLFGHLHRRSIRHRGLPVRSFRAAARCLDGRGPEI